MAMTGKRRAGLLALNVMAWFVVGTVYLNLPDQQPSGALFQWAADFYDRTLAHIHGNAIPCAGCHYKYGLFYGFLFFDVLAALVVGWAVTRGRQRVFPQQVTRFSALFVVLVIAMACMGMPEKGHSDNLELLHGNWFDVYLICFLTPFLTAAVFF